MEPLEYEFASVARGIMSHIQTQKLIEAPKMDVFRYMTDPANLADQFAGKIDVQWQNPGVELQVDSEFLFLMTRYHVEQPIRLRIQKIVTGNSLSYQQYDGMFNYWTHTMRFEDHGGRSCLVTDLIEYEMPLGIFGRLVDDFWWRQDLKNLLEYRLQKVADHFHAQQTNGVAG